MTLIVWKPAADENYQVLSIIQSSQHIQMLDKSIIYGHIYIYIDINKHLLWVSRHTCNVTWRATLRYGNFTIFVTSSVDILIHSIIMSLPASWSIQSQMITTQQPCIYKEYLINIYHCGIYPVCDYDINQDISLKLSPKTVNN